MRRIPPRPAAAPNRRTQLTRRTPLASRRPNLAASEQQRAKVAGRACLVRAKPVCDPAHVIPRALGGCDHPDCVVALCRRHHRAYDRGELDLLPHLEPACRVELAHSVGHLGLVGALRRVTGRRDA